MSRLDTVSLYGVGFQATTFGGTAPLFELQTGPTDFLRVMAFEFNIGSTSGSYVGTIGIGIPAAKGIPLQGYNGPPGIYEDQGNNSAAPGYVFLTQWITAPTAPTTYLRRVSFRKGTPYNTFRFSRGLGVPPSSSLVVNINSFTGIGSITMDASITVEV